MPWMDKISTWWQVDFIVSLPSSTGQSFSLYGIESSSESGLAITTCNGFVHTAIHVFTESLTHYYGILPRMASSQGTNFITKQVQPWDHCYAINWFYHITHYLEMNGYFKVERLTVSVGRQTHIVAIYALTQTPLYSALSLIIRIHESSNQCVEMGVVLYQSRSNQETETTSDLLEGNKRELSSIPLIEGEYARDEIWKGGGDPLHG